MTFVLDTSVSLTWLLDDASPRHRSQAFGALNRLRAEAGVAHVPATWSLEVANVIARVEGQGLVAEAQSTAFLEMLSAYDASYLELAMRMGLPLATLDTDMRRAAPKAGVELVA